MRDMFRQSFNLFYYQQLSPADLVKKNIPATGTFAVDGAQPTTGNGITTFARAMATHPRFAVAWTQKLCTFANSVPCVETDPEFQRVATAFRQSNHDFKVLVRELFSSPLVTFTNRTDTFQDAGYALSIERRDVLCNALEQRLGVKDACGLAGTLFTHAPLARSVPGPGYGRAEVTPVLPRDPNMFFASATSNLCTKLAPLVVDAGMGTRWASARKDEAIADFVHVVMNLAPSDPRAPTVQQILADHHAAALAAKATARDALQSTFIVACTSPYALGIGL
jgi:hypothetical protein